MTTTRRPPRPLVKICGLTRVEDAALAVALGATHVGVVRAPSSPRCASVDEARAIFDAVGESAERVLVFKGVPLETIAEDATRTGASSVQLYDHDDEAVLFLERSGAKVLRVFRMNENAKRLPDCPEPSERRPNLLDVGGGGSGRSFDWSLLGPMAPDHTFIAGGVRPDNVASLLAHEPYGIDLASGVETAPGVKDESKLRRLFQEIHS